MCFYYVVDIRLCQRCFISKSSYTPSYLTPFYPEHLKSRCAKPRFYPLRSLNNPTRFLSVMPFLLRFLLLYHGFSWRTAKKKGGDKKSPPLISLVYLPPFSFIFKGFNNALRRRSKAQSVCIPLRINNIVEIFPFVF